VNHSKSMYRYDGYARLSSSVLNSAFQEIAGLCYQINNSPVSKKDWISISNRIEGLRSALCDPQNPFVNYLAAIGHEIDQPTINKVINSLIEGDTIPKSYKIYD